MTGSTEWRGGAGRMAAWAVAALAGVFLLIGVVFIADPATGAAIFGIPAPGGEGRSYVQALALRDLALGLYLLGLLRLGSRRALGIVLAATVVIPLGDLWLVGTQEGPFTPWHLLLHGASAAATAGLACWLLWWPMARGEGRR